MIRLATVVGSRTNILWHFLTYYSNAVDEICVGVYDWDDKELSKEVEKIIKEFPKAKIVLTRTAEKFNWETVTSMYNEIKNQHPEDWWIVADDDEFHEYSQPLEYIIHDCEENGWDLVRGGFVDRVGPGGTFPEIQPEEDIYKQFPVAGFFRYPLSGACPNKVCIMKGYVELTPGQHYAKIDGYTTWKWQGWDHPLIAPYKEYNVLVNHFKWDATCGERIRAVANTNRQSAYSEEYRKMYRELAKSRFKIDITDPRFMMQEVGDWEHYKHWDKLLNIIISI
jgi:hypothetical protein